MRWDGLSLSCRWSGRAVRKQIFWAQDVLAELDDIVLGTHVSGGCADRGLKLYEKSMRSPVTVRPSKNSVNALNVPLAPKFDRDELMDGHCAEIELYAKHRRHGAAWNGAETLKFLKDARQVAAINNTMLGNPWRYMRREIAADVAGIDPDSLDRWPIRRGKGYVHAADFIAELRRRRKRKPKARDRSTGRFTKAQVAP